LEALEEEGGEEGGEEDEHLWEMSMCLVKNEMKDVTTM